MLSQHYSAMATASTSTLLSIPAGALACNVCATPLNTFEELQLHLTLHAQPYQDDEQIPIMPEPVKAAGRLLCPLPGCSHSTIQRTNLKTHYFRHMGAKPHRCPHLVPSPDAEHGWEKCDFKTVDPACLTRHRRSRHGYITNSAKAALKEASVIPAAVVAVTMTTNLPKNNGKGKGKARAMNHPYTRPSHSVDHEVAGACKSKGKGVARAASPVVKIEGTGSIFDPIELLEWNTDAPPTSTIPIAVKESPAAALAHASLAPPSGFVTSVPAPQYIDCSFAQFDTPSTYSADSSHTSAVEQFLNNFSPSQNVDAYPFVDTDLPSMMYRTSTPAFIPQPAHVPAPSAYVQSHQEYNYAPQPAEDWSTLFDQPAAALPSLSSSVPARVLSPLDHFGSVAPLQSIPRQMVTFPEQAFYNFLLPAAASVASSVPSTPSEPEYNFVV